MKNLYLFVVLLSVGLFVISSGHDALSLGEASFRSRFRGDKGVEVLARVRQIAAVVEYGDTILNNLNNRDPRLRRLFRCGVHNPSEELKVNEHFMRACCGLSCLQKDLKGDFGFVLFPNASTPLSSSDDIIMRDWLLGKCRGVGFTGKELQGFDQCDGCKQALSSTKVVGLRVIVADKWKGLKKVLWDLRMKLS